MPEIPDASALLRTRERVQRLAFAVVLLLTVVTEVLRWASPEQRQQVLAGWLFDRNWTLYLPLLFAAFVCWNWSGRPHPSLPSSAGSERGSLRQAWVICLVVMVVGFAMSRYVAAQFGQLPPAIHDEFSYLFQAETFLAGRCSFPSFAPRPELFDQMHVLNEGRFASRYFPGTGIWLAPFVALGDPRLGLALAHAICAGLLVWIGRELSHNFVGLVAGLLLALSPGVVLYSTQLLAHHPTLLGLLVFLLAFLRLLRTDCSGDAVLAGVALTFAMLCRPMTSAGFAFPFGAWLVWRFWKRGGTPDARVQIRLILGLAIPLVAGLVTLFFYNRAVTGNGLVTPYQLYTDTYTPRHVFGFNNRVRGEQKLGPKVLKKYDEWAVNLTPQLAAENVGHRLLASSRWTLGLLPLGFAAMLFLAEFRRFSVGWRLIAGSIVSLHVAHLPYWFVGMQEWHYVFETAPLWLLLFGEVSLRAIRGWREAGRVAMPWWWGGLVATAVAGNLVTVPPLWPSTLDQGVVENRFSREIYGEFRQRIHEAAAGRPSIVFVIPDPDDLHIDLVSNSPRLDTPILVARVASRSAALEAAQLFPDRLPWLYDASQKPPPLEPLRTSRK